MRGITLIEILVVVVLLVAIGTVATPRIFQTLEDQAQTQSRRISQVINLLRNEAILGRQHYQIIFSPKEQNYTVFVLPKEGDKEQVNSPNILRPYSFPESFVLRNTFLNQQEAIRAKALLQFTTEKDAKEMVVKIDNSGFVSPFVLMFEEDETLWNIYSEGILGKVAIRDITHEN